MPAQARAATQSLPDPLEVPIGEQLTAAQQQELVELVSRHCDVFSTLPGRTHVVAHDIVTEPF